MKPYYEDDFVQLWHGDCREVDAWLTADVLVTDPPYGMALKSGWGGEFGDLKIANDSDLSLRDHVMDAWGDRPAILFGRWSIARPARTRALLIWAKGEHTGMGDLKFPWKPDFEEIYVLGTGFAGHRGTSVLRHHAPSPAKSQGRMHPTEKPLSVMSELIAKCPPGLIADPFAGSGSTLVAAKMLGRRAIGVELDEKYCRLVAQRLAQDALPFGEAS